MSIILRDFGRAHGADAAAHLWDAGSRAYEQIPEGCRHALLGALDEMWRHGGQRVRSLHEHDRLAHAGTIARAEDLADRPLCCFQSLTQCRSFLADYARGDGEERCAVVLAPHATLHMAELGAGGEGGEIASRLRELLGPCPSCPQALQRLVHDWCLARGIAGCLGEVLGGAIVAQPQTTLKVWGFLLERDIDEALAGQGLATA